MTTRDSAPIGAPCWSDIWTSDVEGSRDFYSALLGWESGDPAPEFGGYFMFTHQGVPVAGGMGDMGDLVANNTWTIYLATADAEKIAAAATAAGATVAFPPMAVAELGVQTVLDSPVGAHVGVWQPNEFPGFTVLNEPGTPSWFEIHTREFAETIDFYRIVFDWQAEVVSDTDAFRYSIIRDPDSGTELAGVFDASGFLPEGVDPYWTVYWETEDIDASIAVTTKLGGSVVQPAQDTLYGRVATVADPSGAQFRLRTGPRG